MKAKDIMTKQVACCSRDALLSDVANTMKKYDCGEIPVVVSETDPRPLGVVTDRDIVLRVVAERRDPGVVQAEEIMSAPAVTVMLTASVDECMRVMERHRIRRVPVVDELGRIAGIIAQADIIGLRGGGKVVERVSAR